MKNLEKKCLISFSILICIFIFFASQAHSSRYINTTINPKTFYSPSNEFSLYVNPSNKMGHHSGEHIFRENDKILWEKTFPFTLFSSKIMDNGTIIGYAYDLGFSGFRGPGNYYFVIINKSGDFRLNEKIERKQSSYFHTDPRPLVKGLYIDQGNDRIVLEVYDSKYEEKVAGWIYQLSTGKRLETILPEQLSEAESDIVQWINKEREGEKVIEKSIEDLSDQIKEEEFKIKLEYLDVKSLNQEDLEDESAREIISSLVIDQQGRFAYINSPLNGTLRFVLLSDKGEKIKDFPLMNRERNNDMMQSFGFSFLSGDKFILTLSTYSDQQSSAWIIDANEEKFVKIDNFKCPVVNAIAGYAGGFYLLSTLREKYTSTTELRSYTLEGQLKWSKKDAHGDEKGIWTATDVIIDSKGNVVILENIGNKVKIFDTNGTFIRKIDLEEQWGRKPRYPYWISSISNDEFIIADAIASGGAYIHMDHEGKIINEINLRHEDGSILSSRGVIKSAIDGKLWITDGQALLQIDREGVVRKIVGSQPTEDVINKIEGAAFDSQGNLYMKFLLKSI